MTSYFLSMFYTGNVAAVCEDSLTKFRTKLLQYTSCTNCRHPLSLREQGWWVTFFFCDTKFYLWNSLHSFAGRESFIKTLPPTKHCGMLCLPSHPRKSSNQTGAITAHINGYKNPWTFYTLSLPSHVSLKTYFFLSKSIQTCSAIY